MKTLQELIEDLKSDPALAEALNKALAARAQAGGEADPCEAIAAVAAAQGYAVKPEEIAALFAAKQENVSEADLVKIAGGLANTQAGNTIPMTPYYRTISILSGQCKK